MLSLAILTLATSLVLAQSDGPAPGLNKNPTDTAERRLTGKAFPFAQLPYKADTSPETTDPVYRGPQTGYNNCTGGPSSQTAMCQTLIVNSIDDFCLFAPATLNTVGAAEGETVAYCTKPTHGARVMPAGTLTAVQFIKAPSYIEVTGRIKQENLNIKDVPDNGGELDSGGDDLRGNPLGGLVYSNSLPSTPGVVTQSRVWHLFVGNNMFCMKLCDDKAPNAAGICRHTLDKVGCEVNIPSAMKPDVFESCDGADQKPPQIGVTDIPASSNCKPHQSTELYPVGGGVPTGVPTGSVTAPAGGSVTKPGSGPTGTVSSTPTPTKPSGAAAARVGGSFGVVAVVIIGLVAGAVIV